MNILRQEQPFLKGFTTGIEDAKDALRVSCKSGYKGDCYELKTNTNGESPALEARVSFIRTLTRSVLWRPLFLISDVAVAALRCIATLSHEGELSLDAAKTALKNQSFIKKVQIHGWELLGELSGSLVTGIICLAGIIAPRKVHEVALIGIFNIIKKIYNHGPGNSSEQKNIGTSALVYLNKNNWHTSCKDFYDDNGCLVSVDHTFSSDAGGSLTFITVTNTV